MNIRSIVGFVAFLSFQLFSKQEIQTRWISNSVPSSLHMSKQEHVLHLFK